MRLLVLARVHLRIVPDGRSRAAGVRLEACGPTCSRVASERTALSFFFFFLKAEAP